MKKITSSVLVCVTTIFIAAGCHQKNKADSNDATEARSALSRDSSPSVSASDQNALKQGNLAFACDLYGKLISTTDNAFFSPFSISSALAMTYAGAVGQTAQEMATTLHFTIPADRLFAAFNKLDLDIASRSSITLSGSQANFAPFKLTVANALWGQKDVAFESAFLDTLAVNYGAGMNLVDFKKNPESARNTINKWVSDQTAQRIPILLEQGTIDGSTRLVLTNALYFKANWSSLFATGNTQSATFTLLDGSAVSVNMMYQTADLMFAAGTGYNAVEIPYVGNQVTMLVIVPDSGNFSAIEAELNQVFFSTLFTSLADRTVTLGLPKWEQKNSFKLATVLASLGMTTAFSPIDADFSAMTKQEFLYISNVIHQANLTVDEKGTEAAAATATGMATTAMPVNPVTLNIDRPFIFVIRDIPTNTILFMGRVLNPTK